ncbi:MAG: 2-oxoglutarate dehydrogenase E1 component [Cyclobacteriaceae bacterium]
MDSFSYIANADVNYVDELYNKYKADPTSVDDSWQKFFQGFDFNVEHGISNISSPTPAGTATASSNAEKEIAVYKLINAYRGRAHLRAKTNPVRTRKDRVPYLELEHFGLSKDDLKTTFEAGKELGLENATLREIISALKKIYEGTLGFEYLYIRHKDRQDWFRNKIEKESLNYQPDPENVKRILSKLNEAVVFENFLHTKYIGQKRFSLEGGETTIPALDALINKGSELGVEEFVIGMAHRGRLNVLANTMGKTYEHIFTEFEGHVIPEAGMGDGDVKYHMGYSSDVKAANGKDVHLSLAPNPSHLEAVNPVVEGYVRAKVDRLYKDYSKIVPILIHGDSAVAGQGVVYEVAQMMKLEGYKTGGTIHFVINNQVGFTTDFEDARSSIYCTDVAKVVDAPVFHVNGDDPEAVVFAMKLAIEYRQKFERDVYVDMVCYRRHGHNEADEPKFTQPKLYSVISKHPNPREIYNEQLIMRGDVSADLAKDMDKAFRSLLQDRLNMVKEKKEKAVKKQVMESEWSSMTWATEKDFEKSPATGVSEATIKKVGDALVKLPEEFKPLKQIERLIKNRNEQFFDKKELDWASAELLAYGSLMLEGKQVRLSGQDCQRGTFSHRHAVLKDAETGAEYNSLDGVDGMDETFRVYNSFLSENAVLGFDFGYSMANPNALTIWEAQFGDFANGAQVVIDQFISSSETKWGRMSGLVMLLPHGQEGQGPEHSSARLERFLKNCADNNMVVANMTEPSNFFHALRRQMTWNFRKPLVVMSPKSLLRHPLVKSKVSNFTKGGFQETIDDSYVKAADVKKVVFCSGKVYYDLLEKQQKEKRKDVAIVRLEQLYPFPTKQIQKIVSKYKKAKFNWVQEEPKNAGAWGFILRSTYHEDYTLTCVSRSESASPAVGYKNVYDLKQKEIVEQAFSV